MGESTDTLFRRFLSSRPICHDFRRFLRSGGDIGGLPPPPLPPLSSPLPKPSAAVSCRMARPPVHFLFFGESSSTLLLVHDSAAADDDMYRSSIFRYEPTADVSNAQARALGRLTANSANLAARGPVRSGRVIGQTTTTTTTEGRRCELYDNGAICIHARCTAI